MSKYRELLKEVGRLEPSSSDETWLRSRLVKRVGRPPGKRSDPDFEQVTAYIRKQTHQAVKIELLKNGRQEFSELLESLLQQWLTARC